MNNYLTPLAMISLVLLTGCGSSGDIQIGNEHISIEGSVVLVDLDTRTLNVAAEDDMSIYLDNKTIIVDSSGGQYEFADLKADMQISLNGTKSESGRITAQSITILPDPDRELPSEIIPPEHD